VGFARAETLEEIWNEGWVDVDIPADEFAEFNRPESNESGTRVHTWDSVGKGFVISGIGNRQTGQIRVVTREATEAEFEFFGHHRVPIVITKRF
jgi:hypothetical protein